MPTISIQAIQAVINHAERSSSINTQTLQEGLDALKEIVNTATAKGRTEIQLLDGNHNITGVITRHLITVHLKNQMLPANSDTVDVIEKDLEENIEGHLDRFVKNTVAQLNNAGRLNTVYNKIEKAIENISTEITSKEAQLENAETLDMSDDDIADAETELDTCRNILMTWDEIKGLPRNMYNQITIDWNVFLRETNLNRIYRWFYNAYNIEAYLS